jgi:hypothetical protein
VHGALFFRCAFLTGSKEANNLQTLLNRIDSTDLSESASRLAFAVGTDGMRFAGPTVLARDQVSNEVIARLTNQTIEELQRVTKQVEAVEAEKQAKRKLH